MPGRTTNHGPPALKAHRRKEAKPEAAAAAAGSYIIVWRKEGEGGEGLIGGGSASLDVKRNHTAE